MKNFETLKDELMYFSYHWHGSYNKTLFDSLEPILKKWTTPAFAQNEPWPWVKNEGHPIDNTKKYLRIWQDNSIVLSDVADTVRKFPKQVIWYMEWSDEIQHLILSTLPAPKDEVQDSLEKIRLFLEDHDVDFELEKDFENIKQALKGGDNGK